MDEACRAHNYAIELDGGLLGVRDRGIIESALARPYCGYYKSIAEKAAALTHSLALNHGFLDGNKRTTLFMVGILIGRSSYRLVFRNKRLANTETEEMVLAVVEHKMSLEELVEWYRKRITKV